MSEDIWLDLTADGSESQWGEEWIDIGLDLTNEDWSQNWWGNEWEWEWSEWGEGNENWWEEQPAQEETKEWWEEQTEVKQSQKVKTLDIEWLKNFAKNKREQEAKEQQEKEGTEQKEEKEWENQKPAYSEETRARIRQIYNWVSWDYWSAPVWWKRENEGVEKEKYITKDWLAITPEKYQKVLMENVTLARFIWELEPKLEEHKQMKQIIESLEEKNKFNNDMPDDVYEFASKMQKAQLWDQEAQREFIELIWGVFDQILPWMWGKYYQFLNWFTQSPASKSAKITAKKRLSKKDLLDSATTWLFDGL